MSSSRPIGGPACLREKAEPLVVEAADQIHAQDQGLQLRHLPDTTDILTDITPQLNNLPDAADILYCAAQAIEQAGLDEFTRHAGDIKSSVSDLAEASSDLSRAAESIRPITNATTAIRETSVRLERAASAGRSGSGWSWRAFWWGTAVCAVFVIAILALWAYVLARK